MGRQPGGGRGPGTLSKAAILVLLAVAATVTAACATSSAALDGQASAAAGQRIVLPGLARNGFPGTFAYTVQPGDTLFSIAQRFGTTVEAIATLNAIDDPASIRAGAVYYIPEAPPPAGPSTRIDHGSREVHAVALTFDMGGRVEPALDIMQWLIDHEIKATIFITGATVESPNTDAGRQVLALIDQHRDQFDLGNHSYSHPDFRELTAAQMASQLADTEAAIAAYTTVSPRPLFRPPYGGVDQAVLDGVGAAGYAYTVMWEVDTIDWLPESDGGPSTSEIVSKVVNNAQNGTIVLMHLGGYNTLAALPGIVNGLSAKGFAFVTVGEMVGQ